ncbi:hypothetical protein K2173_006140 [Erythroxylum novogranatense]|uniref:Uncharacterized protein n=1 Tax=Erythroxylum novogranatense TaxID=1862640 RepID=A0AAV8TEF8_9ROSI|nr:hypothetical protein K2173_006140 [Erythroxylum novogranatense]
MLGPLKHLTVASHLSHTVYFVHSFKSQTHETLHCLLGTCSSMKDLKQIHAQIVINGLNAEILTLGKLISFCAVDDEGNLNYARLVFDQMAARNKFMYNNLIRGYSNSNNPVECILMYRRMIGCGLSPNEFTLPFVFKACVCKSDYLISVAVHAQAVKLGIGSQVCVQNGLINAYIACGFLDCAREVFDYMCERTLVSWNLMIGGYSKEGFIKEAFLLFREMREVGVEADEFTLVNLLSVCSQTCDFYFGRFVHLYIEITGIEIDLIVRNALLDMYSKCGKLESAQRVFDQMPYKNVVSWTSMVIARARHGLLEFARETFNRMPVKNVVSWNSLIACYVQKGEYKEVLDLFHEMHNSRVVPDEATIVCVLSACSQIGDLDIGKKIHNYLDYNDIARTVSLCNSLIDMYAKCGAIGNAVDVFEEMSNKSLVSWNVMIGALALHGSGEEAIKLFGKMQAEGLWPDKITFTGLLSACSHGGLIDMGRYYFNIMSSTYSISPEIQHYACMVDLLGRQGLLEEAIKLIGEMPMRPDVVIWGALLGACRIHGNVEIGKQILKQLLALEPNSAGLYVLLSNLFSETQRWGDVMNLRKLMKDHRIFKSQAISFIGINGHVSEFMVDDKQHEVSGGIYIILDQLTDHLRSTGYLCSLSKSFLDLEDL